jgi:S1-C subfamily serine protease
MPIMFRLGIALSLIAWIAVPLRAQDAIPAETVTSLKRATAFIRVEGSNWKATGSGFVVSVEKDVLLVATNYHVVAPPDWDRGPKPTPAALATALKRVTVSVVFDGGSKSEQTVKAEVVAADPEADLAILRVNGVTNPPAAIEYANVPKPSETMPVYTFGYPFGQALATTKGAPAITVGKGSVSSLRLDADGNLNVVQIDGNLNPGNSGGPVVDAKGRLVGVAVSRVRNGQGIGFAVPAAVVARMMGGRFGSFHVVATQRDGKVVVRAELGVIDPRAKISGVNLYYFHVPSGMAKPLRDEPLEKNPAAKKLTLKSDGWTAVAEIPVESSSGEILLQAVPDGADGSVSNVRSFNLAPSKEVVAVAAAGRGPRIQGGFKDPEFEDKAPDGGLLVGIEVGVGRFGNNPVIKSVRPVFRAGGKDSVGEWHGPTSDAVVKETVQAVAKPGYAVGAITVKNGLGLDGLTVTFMKIKDDKLDPNDKYDSDYIGGKGGGQAVRVGGDGTSVIGLIGKTRADTASGLGLLYKDATPPNKKE